MTLEEIAAFIGAELRGEAQKTVEKLAPIAEADASALTFISKAKFASLLKDSNAGAVICRESEAESCSTNTLIVNDPYLAYAKASQLFKTKPDRSTKAVIHSSATIDATAELSEGVHIGANVVIESGVKVGAGTIIESGAVIGNDSIIGAQCRIYPNVTVYHQVIIGNGVEIHSGTVIGADGFGYAPSKEGWIKIEQVGRVIIGDGCQIGANCCIDRGAMQDTILGRGVILDNLIQIGHNVEIGDGTAMAATVGIAGSTKLGKRCMIGGGVGIAGHIELGDDVYISAGTMVNSSLKKPGQYSSGIVAQEHKSWLRNTARFGKLNEMYRRLTKLEELITKNKDK